MWILKMAMMLRAMFYFDNLWYKGWFMQIWSHTCTCITMSCNMEWEMHPVLTNMYK